MSPCVSNSEDTNIIDENENVFLYQDTNEVEREKLQTAMIIILRDYRPRLSTTNLRNDVRKKRVVPPRRRNAPTSFYDFLTDPEFNVVPFEEYSQRSNTFSKWPKSSTIWPSELVSAGFYYLGNAFEVKCATCGIVTNLNTWKPNEKALDRHAQLNPNCEFLKRNGHSSFVITNGRNNTTKSTSTNDVDESDTPGCSNRSTSSAFSSGNISKYPRYSIISNRVASFDSWQFENMQSKTILAECGYFYTGEKDIVRCFCCDLGLAEWDKTDDPWKEHARHSPTCQFLVSKKGEQFIEQIQKEWKKIYNPKHGTLVDRNSRITTFQDKWRTDIEQTPEILADAGFFYEGEEDLVRCHYCDGGLRNWEQGDVPWEEHARWFPYCKFLIKMKGREFIEEIAKRNTEISSQSNQASNTTEQDGSNMDNLSFFVEMGFSLDNVKSAIAEHKKRKGHNSFDMEELIDILVKIQESEKAQHDSTGPETAVAENKKLKEELLCMRCKSKERSILFVNCGHRVTCDECAEHVDYCLYCNTKIKSRFKTFLS